MKTVFIRLFTALAITFSFGSSNSNSAPIVNPYAADLASYRYTASRAYEYPMIESFFNGGYWNAGWWGTYWLQADMGVSHTLSEIKLLTDQTPYGITMYQVYLSDTPIGDNWSSMDPVATHNGFTYTSSLIDLKFTPTAGRYLEIIANGGPSWTALGGGTRIDWNDNGGNEGNGNDVPEPGSMALFGLGMMGFIALRRKT
jgi:hypothetical protein